MESTQPFPTDPGIVMDSVCIPEQSLPASYL